MKKWTAMLVGVLVVLFAAASGEAQIFLGQGSMVGEVGQASAILQSRLTSTSKLVEEDVPGVAGVARFEVSTSRDFKESQQTPWLKAEAAGDFIVKRKISGLKPATRYFYRVVYGSSMTDARPGPIGSFSTLQKQTGVEEVSFVVVTGMNYVSFYHGKLGKTDPKTKKRSRDIATSYQGDDKAQGFPAL